MSLKNEISKIKMMINEINELKLRRVYPELRSVIQYILEHSHPCDFDDSDHFFYGIKDEIFDDGFWLEYDLDWEDVEFALLEYFREMIEDHYNYECQSKMNGEIMEYPNFVYESEDNTKFRRRYSVPDEYLKKIVDSLGNHQYITFDNLYKDVVKELVNNLEGIPIEERDRMGEMYLADQELKKRVKDYSLDNMVGTKAVIEITKPLAYMEMKYYYQAVPFWKTKDRTIDVKKNGREDHKVISTKNIKVLKVFNEDETEEMEEYLNKLRSNF